VIHYNELLPLFVKLLYAEPAEVRGAAIVAIRNHLLGDEPPCYNMGMMDDSARKGPPPARESSFPSTQWTAVVCAGCGGSESGQALARLCEDYWFPLYAFVRRSGYAAADAEDLTQEFFAWLLEKHVLAAADRQRGRFRSFLLAAAKNFLANQWDRAHAQKRGGGVNRLSLDFDAGESRLHLEPSHDLTAERLFERQWALTLLDRVMRRLDAEYEASGKGPQFQRIKQALTGDCQRLPYAAWASELGISEEAARQAASRLRKRYRELLREEVAQTLAEPADVDQEIRELFAALGG
jgi:DNA-directed RNA polymerase specialized sigma24 family protein